MKIVEWLGIWFICGSVFCFCWAMYNMVDNGIQAILKKLDEHLGMLLAIVAVGLLTMSAHAQVNGTANAQKDTGIRVPQIPHCTKDTAEFKCDKDDPGTFEWGSLPMQRLPPTITPDGKPGCVMQLNADGIYDCAPATVMPSGYLNFRTKKTAEDFKAILSTMLIEQMAFDATAFSNAGNSDDRRAEMDKHERVIEEDTAKLLLIIKDAEEDYLTLYGIYVAQKLLIEDLDEELRNIKMATPKDGHKKNLPYLNLH